MFGIPEEHIDKMIAYGDEIVTRPNISLIEECGELIAALGKFENDREPYELGRDHVFEEITHVLVSINCFARMYGYDEKYIKKEISRKALKAGWDPSEYAW